MTDWIQSHWETIALITLVISSVLTAVTKHFSEWPLITRWANFALDLLSFIPSKGSVGPRGANVKPPFVPSRKPTKARRQADATDELRAVKRRNGEEDTVQMRAPQSSPPPVVRITNEELDALLGPKEK